MSSRQVVSLGTHPSDFKDFYDVRELSRKIPFQGAEAAVAFRATFDRRAQRFLPNLRLCSDLISLSMVSAIGSVRATSDAQRGDVICQMPCKYVLWYLKPPASAKSLMMRQRSTCQLGSKVRARVGRRRLVQSFLRQKTVL